MSFIQARVAPKVPFLGTALAIIALLTFGVANVANAQEKVVKKAPMQQTDPSSGKAMYESYCAACHGSGAKGDGPAASELKTPPTNLTQLAKSNHSEFPADHVWAILQFGAKAPAHGSNDMPVWGTQFRGMDPHDPVKANQRIQNLVDYLKTLQVK
ncbi:MAG TPA: cytochrome c [Candidatus Acidoferrum sp.]|jgi:mono/diheme cytochrome c family protein